MHNTSPLLVYIASLACKVMVQQNQYQWFEKVE